MTDIADDDGLLQDAERAANGLRTVAMVLRPEAEPHQVDVRLFPDTVPGAVRVGVHGDHLAVFLNKPSAVALAAALLDAAAKLTDIP